MSGTIEIKNKKKGERAVKALIKKRVLNKVDTDTGIPGAGKQIEKLEKRIKSLEDTLTGLGVTVGKLHRWKMESEMKDTAG